MNPYFTDPYKMKQIKDALKVLVEHPIYPILEDYEANVLNGLISKDNSLSISHPNYERMKAYLQGQINALRLLFESRKQILKMQTGGLHDDRRETDKRESEGFNF